jgi:hypothetical protein
MASYRKRGNVWYYRFVDADGVKRERKGCSDKRVTEDLARNAESEAARIRAGELDPREIARRDHEARPLEEHLDDFRSALLAKGRTTEHANLYRTRAGKVAELARARR